MSVPAFNPPSVLASLDFARVRTESVARMWRWHSGADDWSGADWSNAMCGEAGEAANVVKKLRRNETSIVQKGNPATSDLLPELADELADVALYADLLAAYYGIDLGAAVAAKFNRVSEAQGFPERLP